MKRMFTRRKLVAIAVAVVALAAAGLVSAAWLANGTGSGYAKAGTASALSTVDVSAYHRVPGCQRQRDAAGEQPQPLSGASHGRVQRHGLHHSRRRTPPAAPPPA